jgi:hypothetical protein
MTKGVLLFASNSSSVRYTDIAEQCAARCVKHLNVPVSVVSSTPNEIKNPQVFDQIISIPESDVRQFRNFKDGNVEVVDQWKNYSRAYSWDLSPYNETLVIDVDYFLYTDVLKFCFEQPEDLVISKHSQDLSFWRDGSEFKYLGLTQLDFYWATVFFFRKTPDTEIFFNFIKHIEQNWIYYKQRYQFNSRLYRNDYAFTIASHVLKELVTPLPFKLHYVTDRDKILSISDDCCKALIQNNKDYIVSDIRNIDIHIMNKLALQELINE